MHILFFVIPVFLPRCTGFRLGTPWPSDSTQSITIFTGGMLSLSWTINSSDPGLFDLVLVGVSGDAKTFPGIPSKDLGLDMVFTSPPENYFFRALDNTTGATLAESSMFEVTASPMTISAEPSATAPDKPPFMSPFTTLSGDMLAISMPTQSQSSQTSTEMARGTLIGVILGAVAWTAIIAVGLVWFFCARRRRAVPMSPVLIDDDLYLSKIRSEEQSLPLYVQLSPFPAAFSKPAPPTLSPLRVSGLRPVTEWPSTPSTAVSLPSLYRSKSGYNYGSMATSPTSSYGPPPKYGKGWYEYVSQHRDHKQSYDLPSSPSAASFKDRAGSMALSTMQRLEQDELETALSDTVCDKAKELNKEGTSKRHKRPPPLRLRTIGSTDGHDCEPDVRGFHQSESPVATPR